MVDFHCIVLHGHHLSLGRKDFGDDAHILPAGSLDGGLQADGGIVGGYVGRGELGTPYGYMHRLRGHDAHVAVQARTRIPARRLGAVLQSHGQYVRPTVLIYIRCNVAMEGIVAAGPEASFLPVDVDARLAHGAVEHERHLLARRSVERGTIPPHSHVGQAARTTCLHRSSRLEVLRHGHILQVVATVEGTVDGPVVGYGDRLPLRVVKLRLHGIGHVALRKSPVLLQQRLRALLGGHHPGQQQATQGCQHSSIHRLVSL